MILSFYSYASVQVVLKNEGVDAFKLESYGESIIIERRITESSSTLTLKDQQGWYLLFLEYCKGNFMLVNLVTSLLFSKKYCLGGEYYCILLIFCSVKNLIFYYVRSA